MTKKPIVISLGGSLIIPDKIDVSFLEQFKKTLRKHYKKYKFIIVCGGGSIARKYISVLKAEGKSTKEQSQAGIRSTRLNAQFMIQLFGKEANDTLPLDMKSVKSNISKNKVIFCGALRYTPDTTSDGTAARLAHYLKAEFINLTNVPGLYTSNPKKSKSAKFIPKISWDKFQKMANKSKFKPGQHFVLDQPASKMIKKHKIKTYILGENLNNLDNFLSNRKFKGTIIEG